MDGIDIKNLGNGNMISLNGFKQYDRCFSIFCFVAMAIFKKMAIIERDIVNRYSKGLKVLKELFFQNRSKPCNALYVIRLKLELWQITRNDFIDKLNKKGIGLAVHYKPIQVTFYKKMYKLKNDDYPRANELFDSIVSLPIYPLLVIKKLITS